MTTTERIDATLADAVLGAADYAVVNGLALLGPRATRLVDALDRLFTGWAPSVGGVELTLPPLQPVRDLATVDYFVNFPHLGLATAGLSAEAAASIDQVRPESAVPASALNPAEQMLPSAACYGLYFALRGRHLADPVVRTLRSQCFRRETEHDGLQRMLGFRMREIVYVGTSDGARDHLETFRGRVSELIDALGITIAVETAQDPFYDGRSSRALLQRLDPVKHEFVAYGATAIASLNVHRNFFGERCDIRVGDEGDLAATSCVAFGLERWLWALSTRFSGDLDAAYEAINALDGS